ncbi:MAG: SDR family oxidoreductase [Aquamicrobium sp.]|nr:SDR family oxidoreductase [Aquamicrobium sp.]
MKKLDGKVCLITGGAGSLGAAAARLFIEQGAAVVLVDRDAERLNEVARDLPQERVATIVADVASAEGAVRLCRLSRSQRFGAIDVLFSNAGNFGTVRPIADYPDDVFGEVLSVHVRGAYLAAKHAAPHMRTGGSIVITSSVAGVRGDAGVYAYITAKHAQVGTDAMPGEGACAARHPREHHPPRPDRQRLSARGGAGGSAMPWVSTAPRSSTT